MEAATAPTGPKEAIASALAGTSPRPGEDHRDSASRILAALKDAGYTIVAPAELSWRRDDAQPWLQIARAEIKTSRGVVRVNASIHDMYLARADDAHAVLAATERKLRYKVGEELLDAVGGLSGLEPPAR